MTPAALTRHGDATLTAQLVTYARDRIDQRLWRTGERIPSICHMAATHGESRFTVVAAYERLAELGLVEARQGAGYFVRPPAGPRKSVGGRRGIDAGTQGIDVHWLLRNMHGTSDPARAPGSGFLPPDWYPGELIAAALRAVGRQSTTSLTRMGSAEGYLPLRDWLQSRLATLDIPAPAEQIVLTHGATQVLDILASLLLQPGDSVFVEDPAWFLMGVRCTHERRLCLGRRRPQHDGAGGGSPRTRAADRTRRPFPPRSRDFHPHALQRGALRTAGGVAVDPGQSPKEPGSAGFIRHLVEGRLIR